MHWKLFDVEDDMVLKNDHEERKCRIEPEADLERLHEPRTTGWNAVHLGVVKDEIDRHPKGSEEEAFMLMMQ